MTFAEVTSHFYCNLVNDKFQYAEIATNDGVSIELREIEAGFSLTRPGSSVEVEYAEVKNAIESMKGSRS